MRRTSRNRRAIATIWVVVCVGLLVVFLGLMIDVLHVARAAQQLQTAADAAALAGAQRAYDSPDTARALAITTAAANAVAEQAVQLDANAGNDAAGDIVIGRFNRVTGVFTATLRAPNAVLVNARRTQDSLGGSLNLLFGSAFGVPSVNLQRHAVAMREGTGFGVIVLNNSAGCALHLQGNASLVVDGGGVQVNSSSSSAVCNTGRPTLHARSLNVDGGASGSFTSKVDLGDTEVDLDTGKAITDPLASLPIPPYSTSSPQTIKSGHGAPGYYPTGISMNNGSLALDPGIYVLGPPGLNLNGGTITASGVMFYILKGGSTNIGGNANVTLTPPDPDTQNFPGVTTYEGVSVFQARDNTAAANVGGTGSLNLQGTLYFPKAFLQLGGNGGASGTGVIADTVEVYGNAKLNVDYSNAWFLPGNRVFLVQ